MTESGGCRNPSSDPNPTLKLSYIGETAFPSAIIELMGRDEPEAAK